MTLRALFINAAFGISANFAFGEMIDAPADPSSLLKQASDAYVAKDFAHCAEFNVKAIGAGAPGANPPYNAACCFALTGKRDEAFRYLAMAIQKGWIDVAHLEHDGDLSSIHADARWVQTVSDCKAGAEKVRSSITQPDLRDELLKRMAEDQDVRKSAKMDAKEMIRIDKANTARMKEIVDRHGWPGRSMVGRDGAFAAFLLVQHADADREFQAYCLELMQQALEQDEVRAQDVAYLTDRVLVAQDKKQLYGTQFHTVAGKHVPRPIEDELDLDARRAKMGLGPFAEYKEIMEGRASGG